jgi:hypothetical protein
VNQKPLVDLVRRMLFQLFILRPGLTQHGNIGVRVLSQRQKILIRRLGLPALSPLMARARASPRWACAPKGKFYETLR